MNTLSAAIAANRELARLSGICSLLPDESNLLSAIVLKEASASSEIGNIITTHDELYRELVTSSQKIDQSAKEVLSYRSALYKSYKALQNKGNLTINTITEILQELEMNTAGIRRTPGTSLINAMTGEKIYTPPDNPELITSLLSNLEAYINIQTDTDPLIQMAVAHYQFESIHPFYDRNGRTDRIVNVLFLVLKGLLESPVLYLSSYINRNKSKYYHLLQNLHMTSSWEEWILFMLKALKVTSRETLSIIRSIVELMNTTTEQARKGLFELLRNENTG
ncbi:MAG: Fic family protein [Spirochaetaceae bacterium]|nr:Fic family protein [Spirochaetaceae bacterium]